MNEPASLNPALPAVEAKRGNGTRRRTRKATASSAS